jgi:hypothetical protein
MSVLINADTSDGLKLTSDTSGEIKLQSAGTDTVTVNTSGNVGIGTSSPSSILDVQAASGVSMFRLTATTGTNAVYSRYSNTGGYLYLGRDNSSGTDFGSAYAAGIWSTGAYPMLFGTNGTERMRIDSSGSLRVGGTSSFSLNEKIALYGTSTANNPTIISDKSAAGVVSSNHVLFNNGNGYVGSITTLSSATAYNTSSDYRLKDNVLPMSGSIDRLKQLKPSTWSWKLDGSHGEGFIAHEAQAVVPEAISGTKDAMRTEEYEVTPAVLDDDGNVVTEAVMGTREVPDYQGIDQSKLVPLLTAALQEAITKIEDLETRIQALENA